MPALRFTNRTRKPEHIAITDYAASGERMRYRGAFDDFQPVHPTKMTMLET